MRLVLAPNDDRALSKALDAAPIGVFDSGMGGLAVARYLQQSLPKENFIFFGDTAHLPYGSRSPKELMGYFEVIVDFLLQHRIKALVVACNTMSTVAGEWLRDQFAIPVINVIDPIAARLSGVYERGQRLGLVGTTVTVNSGVYEKRIRQHGGRFALEAWAVPELVPMIEELRIDNGGIERLLKSYADRFNWRQLDGMILGCTHYPWVYQQFQAVLGPKVKLWDAGEVTAQQLKDQLIAHDLLTSSAAREQGDWLFYLTELRPNIQNLIARFWRDYDLRVVNWQGE